MSDENENNDKPPIGQLIVLQGGQGEPPADDDVQARMIAALEDTLKRVRSGGVTALVVGTNNTPQEHQVHTHFLCDLALPSMKDLVTMSVALQAGIIRRYVSPGE